MIRIHLIVSYWTDDAEVNNHSLFQEFMGMKRRGTQNLHFYIFRLLSLETYLILGFIIRAFRTSWKNGAAQMLRCCECVPFGDCALPFPMVTAFRHPSYRSVSKRARYLDQRQSHPFRDRPQTFYQKNETLQLHPTHNDSVGCWEEKKKNIWDSNERKRNRERRSSLSHCWMKTYTNSKNWKDRRKADYNWTIATLPNSN